MQSVEITLEISSHLCDLLQVGVFDHDLPFLVEFPVVLCQGNSSLESVADLSSVEIQRLDHAPLDVFFRVQCDAEVFRAFPRKLVDERRPNLLALIVLQGRVVQLDVDAGNEGIVEGAYAVGGQEQHSLECFQRTEETCD